ncbi:hypothetical protein [Brevibacterium album]|uniref:hypothetical protein n=1 Tax=Brevibacterium album TaxID=417948 RepID=UPI00040D10D1|nr:hypothetical protein [Brevibacterium album]
MNHRHNSATGETEARKQFTAEFSTALDAHKGLLQELRTEVKDLKVEIAHLRLELRESEEYVNALIAGIANGTVPPIPARERTLVDMT